MSKEIEQRVVEMRFDNKQFESATATTMSTLDKLKQKLNFTGASKGLEDIGSAAKKIDMTGLASAVDTVRTRFSALEVMGVTSLANITNSAVNAGKRIVSALTIDPIKTGFQEYETQINAVQTILANTESKGSTLSDVNKALNELNEYADQTIYNFTEMTRNIGTFTAAGVDLDKSVTSIKGIANLAAVSGSNSQQASTAMYQLSQALAAGKVSLMDWNSVVNAGMGGELFQNALKRTAENFGYNVDEMIKKYGSFRESLTEGGWLTAEVLTETLTQLSGAYTEADLIAQGFTAEQAKEITQLAETAVNAATKVKTFTQLWDTLKESAQSGWTQTWEILIGDFEEAKDLLTELSEIFGEIIGKSAEARNTLLYETLTSNWKKITDGITDAGLSAEDFKDKVTEIGKSKGLNIDEIVAEYGSLEAAFKNGALSSDLLNEALLEMTGTSEEISKKLDDLRGKYKTNTDILNALIKAGYENSDIQELITKNANGQTIALNDLSDAQLMNIGYTAEQVEKIRELSDYAELAGGSLKTFMDNVAAPQGRELLIDSLRVSLRSLIAIFSKVGQAWRDVFPPMTSDELYNIIKSLQEFVLAIRPSEETLNNLQRTFRGLFSILSIGKQIISAVVSAVGSLLGNFDGLGGGILSVTASIGDWLYNLDKVIQETGVLNTVFQGIAQAIQIVIDAFKYLAGVVQEKFVAPGLELFSAFLENISERMSQVSGAADSMESGVSESIAAMGAALASSNFVKFLQTLWNGIKTIGTELANVFGRFAGILTDNLASANFSGILDFINTLIAGGIGVAIYNFVNGLGGMLDSVEGFTENLVGILDEVRGCFEAYQSNLKASTLLKIATAIGILAASILVISTIDSEKLSASLGAITVLFANLMGSMALFGKIGGLLTSVIRTSTVMIAVSVSVLILASALKKLSDMDLSEIATGLVGVGGLTAIVIAAAKAMSSGTKTIISGATQMVIFAAALKILASVAKDLSALSWEELAKGLTGVGVLMAAVSIFLNTAKFSGKSITTATGIVILSSAMNILAIACRSFGQLNWEEISKGLASIGALLLEVAIFTNLIGNAKHVLSTATSLTIIGAAMLIFANAAKSFASMQWTEIGRGLTGMAGALAAVTLAVNLMPKNMIGIGTGLVIVSSSLLIMYEALSRMGDMSWEQIGAGLTALGGSMLILAVGLNAMRGTLAGSAAMLVASTALAILTPMLKILGSMSWESIAKGLVTIAGAFAVVGAAGALLTPIIPSILGLSGSLALIGLSVVGLGAGFLAIGAGLSAIAVGLTALAASVAGGGTAIAAGLAVIITSIVSLIPAVAEKIGEGIITFAKVISEGAPEIGNAIKSVVLTLIDVFVECAPALADGILSLIAGVLDALVSYTPQIIDSVMEFLILLIDGIAARLPELIVAGVGLIMAFFSGIVDALSGIDVDTLLKGIAGVGLLTAIIAALGAITSMIPGAMVGVLGVGVVIAELALVLAAIGALSQIPGLNWLINEGGELLENVGAAIGSFIGGIVGGVLSGISSQFPEIASDLSAFMENIEPFIEGAKGIDSSTMDGVKALAEAILILTAANVLDSVTSWLTGGSSLTKFAEELVPFGTAMKDFSESIAGVDGTLVENAANAGKALAEMAATIPNTGGLVSFFTGENDMAAFGEALVPFGDSMVAFSQSISGMDADAVVNAATAGEALTKLADTIPNTGGLVSFFTGDNDMATFGEDLVSFGASFSSYAALMKYVDPNVVVASANAADSLVKLAEGLPDNKLFTNETTLDEFGSQLKDFGTYFYDYYNSISEVNTVKLASVIMQVRSLINLGNDMAGFDSEAMKNFGKSLQKLGDTGVDGFIEAFDGSVSKVSAAAEKMLTTFISAASSKKSDLDSAFASLMEGIIAGIQSKQQLFNTTGGAIVISFVGGITINSTRVVAAFTTIITSSLSTLNSSYESFKTAGGYVVEGFAQGIKDNINVAVAQAKALANSAATAARNELDIHSPSGVFENIGNFVDQGFAKGIEDGIPDVETATTNMGSSITAVITAYFDQNPTSYIGSEIVGDISEGITEDMSAEEAAEKKAQNIANAFQEELDKFDLDLSTADLEYQLWEAMYGATATESEKTAAELENLSKKLQLQNEKVKLAQAEYEMTMAEFGNSASQTQEAYNELLQQQLDLTDISSQITEIQQSMVQSNNDAYQKYLEYLNENQAELLAMGFTMEQLEENARNKSGYNPDLMAENMQGTVQQAVNSAMSTVGTAYQKSAESTFGQMVSQSQDIGSSIATGVNTGIQNGMNQSSQNVVSSVESCVATIRAQREKWVEAGSFLVEGFAEGITINTFMAEAQAEAMANAAYTAAMAALQAHSPSKRFIKVGGYVVMGFVRGIESGIRDTQKASDSMANAAIETTRNTIAKLADAINGDMDTQPTIRPVLDLSEVESGTRRINSLLSRKQAMSIGSHMKTSVNDDKSSDTSTPTAGASYQFVQNNYSPKALSRVEIYRQTKNQFSALERKTKV